MSELLSENEIKTVTGYDQASKQCQALHEQGIFFVKDRYGFPHTTWFNFNHPAHLRPHAFLNVSGGKS